MKGHWISYSQTEMDFIRDRCTMIRADLHAAFVKRFDRADVSLKNLNALCKRNGWMTGRNGQFNPDQISWNKGKKMPFNANSARTQFQKGERRGAAVRLYKPIGTERRSKDGYLERKINDDLPLQGRWRAVHLINWEQVNGPLPAGMALKCLDGDKANLAPSNWEAIPRALLPRLNGINGRGYDKAPDEAKSAIMATTKLEHKVRTLKTARKGG